MEAVFAAWSPDFLVALARDHVIPCVGGGFVLGAMGWLVGFVVSGLFDALAGAFRL